MKRIRLLRVGFCILAFIVAAYASAEEIWIDVRSSGEYEQDHISGDILIPHTAISKGIQGLGLDKDAKIFLYCAAGIRAEMAKSTLLKMGYNNVQNVGDIHDARRLRKE